MAAGIQPPEWSKGDGPRVLIEATEWAERAHVSRLLADAGYQTATCPGPEGSDRPCPLTTGGSCSAAQQADAVVHLLRHSDARNRHVLRSLKQHYGDVALVVCAPEPTVEAYPDDFEGTVVIGAARSEQAVLQAVDDAITGQSHRQA